MKTGLDGSPLTWRRSASKLIEDETLTPAKPWQVHGTLAQGAGTHESVRGSLLPSTQRSGLWSSPWEARARAFSVPEVSFVRNMGRTHRELPEALAVTLESGAGVCSRGFRKGLVFFFLKDM